MNSLNTISSKLYCHFAPLHHLTAATSLQLSFTSFTKLSARRSSPLSLLFQIRLLLFLSERRKMFIFAGAVREIADERPVQNGRNNLKLKRTRNSSLAPSCLRFITGVC